MAQGQRGVLETDPNLQVTPVSWLPIGGGGSIRIDVTHKIAESPFVLRSLSAWVSGRAGSWTPQGCLHVCEVAAHTAAALAVTVACSAKRSVSLAVGPKGRILWLLGRSPRSSSQSSAATEGTGQIPQQHVQRVLSTMVGLYFDLLYFDL